MQVKIKKTNQDGIVRLESSGEIREIMLNPNFMDPSKERVTVCFMGKNSSGIIDFSIDEAEGLMKSLSHRVRLIKESKLIR